MFFRLWARLPRTRPSERAIRSNRRARGRKDFRLLSNADWVVVSWGKSGRTWLRVILSCYYKLRYKLSGDPLFSLHRFFGAFYRLRKPIPRVLFTHDNYLRDYTGNCDSLRDFYHKKVILLVRDPRDVAVSQYFQWKYRMRRHKKIINRYPLNDLNMFDFLLHDHQGLSAIIRFMNQWAEGAGGIQDFLMVRYEDLRQNPEEQVKALLQFVGEQDADACVQEAIEYASFANMRARESNVALWKRLFPLMRKIVPGSRDNPDSFKTRKGKVGGYRDYLDSNQIKEINNLMKNLNPVYGYGLDS